MLSIRRKLLGNRPVVFLLAASSFACLLGQFYGLWTMHAFACWVLLPASALLVVAAWHSRKSQPEHASVWITYGAAFGFIAALGYDLYRLPFVLAGAPLFKVFPRFGELLLNRTEPRWAVDAVGWAYHFSNGMSLGIMFLVIASCFQRPPLFWGAVAWALLIEVMLLLTPYSSYFGIPLNGAFLFLTASAHLIFGAILGFCCRLKSTKPLVGQRVLSANS